MYVCSKQQNEKNYIDYGIIYILLAGRVGGWKRLGVIEYKLLLNFFIFQCFLETKAFGETSALFGTLEIGAKMKDQQRNVRNIFSLM